MRSLVLLVLLMVTSLAFGHGVTPSPAATLIQQGGSVNAPVEFKDRLQIPNTPPAIAPASTVMSDCPIVLPKTTSTSLLVWSHSEVTGLLYSDVCYALKRGQTDVADKLMCLQSADYRKSNPACSSP